MHRAGRDKKNNESKSMYSFGPLPKLKQSGRIIGAHQKIDRLARRHFTHLAGKTHNFPNSKEIIHFEGMRGPDGVKIKSPGIDEPWHFIDLNNPGDTRLMDHINDHRNNLVVAIKQGDRVKMAFEAAWLAHAITDGLTPAHQVPYDEIMAELRGDVDESYLKKVRSKAVMPGNGSAKKFIKNNWGYWGAGGVMTSHTLFEAGVATAISSLKYDPSLFTNEQIYALAKRDFSEVIMEAIKEVAALGMYEKFKKSGWGLPLAKKTRQILLPIIVRTVTFAWYHALMEAEQS